MSSAETTEVYIPKDASVRIVPVQSLPSSLVRKMGVRPLQREPQQSAHSSSQKATWICPVELRERGASSGRTGQTQCFLTQGQVMLPVVSSNPTASKVFSQFLFSDRSVLQDDKPDTPVVCSRVSSHRQNTIILYDGQIFLSVRKKKTLSGQSDSRSLILPDTASRRPLPSAQRGSPVSVASFCTPQRPLPFILQYPGSLFNSLVEKERAQLQAGEHESAAAPDSSSQDNPVHGNLDGTKEKSPEAPDSGTDGGIGDVTEKRRNKSGDDRAVDEDEEPMGEEAGGPSNEEHDNEGDVGVEKMENIKKGDHQAGGQLDSGGDGQNVLDDSHLNDMNMNTNDVKKLSVTVSSDLHEVMDSGAELENEADGDVTVKVPEEHETSGLPAEAYRSDSEAFPVITHITSLAEGWSGAAGMENHGDFYRRSKDPKEPEEPQHCEPADGESLKLPRTVAAEVSVQSGAAEAQAPPPDPSPQENGGEAPLPWVLPSETRQLDFEDLERKERVNRIRKKLRNIEAKLETVNGQ